MPKKVWTRYRMKIEYNNGKKDYREWYVTSCMQKGIRGDGVPNYSNLVVFVETHNKYSFPKIIAVDLVRKKDGQIVASWLKGETHDN